ncbi:hypothetical protein FB451DRAFT_1387467 [Mycena latifolia]|nr:hypothetical protein FB451DRAFT_1387467 [Mycena latifolia]
MSTQEGFAARLTPAQDKAFKIGGTSLQNYDDLLTIMRAEAIRHKGQPVTRQLDLWLSSYLPGPPTGSRRQGYYERRRAELVAKKARVQALMDLRARALREGSRRWPRLREAREKDIQQRALKSKQLEDARKAARAVIEAKEARAAADARVAVLMALRMAGGKRSRK